MKFPLNNLVQRGHDFMSMNALTYNHAQRYVNVNVIFGDPRRNCLGTGICQLLSSNQQPHHSCQGGKAKASLGRFDHEYLQLIINKNQLTSSMQSKYLSLKSIPICKDIPLNNAIAESLKIQNPAFICAGQYELKKQDQYYYFFAPFR